jgi:hypothetical protein
MIKWYKEYSPSYKYDKKEYCTALAVLVRNNRLSHLIVHTFYSPTTVGVTIAQLQLKNCRTLDVFPSWRPADH